MIELSCIVQQYFYHTLCEKMSLVAASYQFCIIRFKQTDPTKFVIFYQLNFYQDYESTDKCQSSYPIILRITQSFFYNTVVALEIRNTVLLN